MSLSPERLRYLRSIPVKPRVICPWCLTPNNRMRGYCRRCGARMEKRNRKSGSNGDNK